MCRGENSYSLPIDLIIEILSRLPTKSIARFSCVTKSWGSMLASPYFKELFLTRSSARPRLLFAVQRDGSDLCVFSSSQPHDPYEKSSSLVVTADFHMKLPKDMDCRHAFGLVHYIGRMRMVICNPSTQQVALLPKHPRVMRSRNYLGFDPVDKQFKVLSINVGKLDVILALGGAEDNSWREISCPLKHLSTFGLPEGICVNGVLYYFATQNDGRSHLIVCFDVRSEEFKFIYKDFFELAKETHTGLICGRGSPKLINYKGKLGVITQAYVYSPWDRNKSLRLCMSVIKDVQNPKSEWSEHVYTLRKARFFECGNGRNQIVGWDVSVVGVTATGDIVLYVNDASNPLYVFYLNMERNTLQRVEFQTANHEAFEKCRGKVILSVDHVEDLNFINLGTTYAASMYKSMT